MVERVKYIERSLLLSALVILLMIAVTGKAFADGIFTISSSDGYYGHEIDYTDIDCKEIDSISVEIETDSSFVNGTISYTNASGEWIHSDYEIYGTSIVYAYDLDLESATDFQLQIWWMAPIYIADGEEESYLTVNRITFYDSDGNVITNKIRVVEINEINFPDDDFRQAVSNLYDEDKDGWLDESEISCAGQLYINGEEGSSANLKGIEFLSNLHELEICNVDITNLNISDWSTLEYLYLENTGIASLEIENLNCYNGAYFINNGLVELRISGSADMTLHIQEDSLTSLSLNDVSSGNLFIDCDSIIELDLTSFKSESLYGSGSAYDINLSGCTNLKKVILGNCDSRTVGLCGESFAYPGEGEYECTITDYTGKEYTYYSNDLTSGSALWYISNPDKSIDELIEEFISNNSQSLEEDEIFIVTSVSDHTSEAFMTIKFPASMEELDISQYGRLVEAYCNSSWTDIVIEGSYKSTECDEFLLYLSENSNVVTGFESESVMSDVDQDGDIDSDDAIYLLYHSLLPEEYPVSDICDPDFNGDATVDSDDAIYLLYHTLLPEEYPLKNNEKGTYTVEV